jgi:hypothetical protein
MTNKQLDINFIRRFKDKINWNTLCETQNPTAEFLEEFAQYVDWNCILSIHKLNEDIINKHYKIITHKHKYSLYEHQTLSEEFLRDHIDDLEWGAVSQYQKLSEEFIFEFADKIKFGNVSYAQTLSENVIRKFQDRISWANISKQQILSEDFMREFEDNLNWSYISRYQVFSEEFMLEFIDKLDFNIIVSRIINFQKPVRGPATFEEWRDRVCITEWKALL